MVIPSESYPNALAALQELIVDGTAVRAAVAFDTTAGVEHFAGVLAETQETTLEITARAADVTEPDALLALRDDLGADVSVVIGRHARSFHPKLWLIERDDRTVVFSGSGNLTTGGMVNNDEQFEVIECAAGYDAAEQHERFERLTRHSQPLDAIERTAIWQEWLSVRKRQAHDRRELARIEQSFIAREPIPDRVSDKAQLIEELQRIYDETVAADLPRADGEQYYPPRGCSWRSTTRGPENVTQSTSSATRSASTLMASTSSSKLVASTSRWSGWYSRRVKTLPRPVRRSLDWVCALQD